MSNASHSYASQLINELELAIQNGSADYNFLDQVQHRLDVVNAHIEMTGYGRDAHKLAELQALICAAQGRADDAHQFVAKAITLAGGFDNLSSQLLKHPSV